MPHTPIESLRRFHMLSADETLKDLSTDTEGLDEKEALRRLEKYGPNQLSLKKRRHPIHLFIKQYQSLLVYVLLLAAIISYASGHHLDAQIILAIIFINSIVGFIQEHQAENSIAALQNMVKTFTKVMRSGQLKSLEASELVPGDIIHLEEGDKVPADARIIQSRNLKAMESSLTGESVPSSKNSDKLDHDAGLGDRSNMLFMGTTVVAGKAIAVITATASDTAIGNVSKIIKDVKKEPGHYERATSDLTKAMAIFAFLGAGLTFIIGYFFMGIELFEIFLFAVASLVSGIPEGLIVVLAIVLAIGANRMAKRNALVRHLPSIETIGAVTIIATDKTGTLTQNKMNVKKIIIPEQKDIVVSGNGWEPMGKFKSEKKGVNPLQDPVLKRFMLAASICNNSKVVQRGSQFDIIGDPTEGALEVMAQRAGFEKKQTFNSLWIINRFTGKDVLSAKLLDEQPFDSKKKYRASLIDCDGEKEIYALGAPEKIISLCSHLQVKNKIQNLNKGDISELHADVQELASDGMRVVALAYRSIHKSSKKMETDDVDNLTLLGFAGMRDPPRPEVADAIKRAKKAGIRVVMKTGDHKETALAIAREIGIVSKDEPCGRYPPVLTEDDLERMNEREFDLAAHNVNVFARLTPKMKYRIVNAHQRRGEIVAMTGDGVNDAPALKKADVGIAMGLNGTDVARDASVMILTDDNFASIIDAVEEGRVAFANIRQTSSHLLSTSITEAVFIITSLIAGLPLPFLPKHILWLNLVTAGTGDIALATEPNHGDVMHRPPRKKKEPILSPHIFPFMAVVVLAMFISSLSIFVYYLHTAGLELARTAAFVTLAFSQTANLRNMRSLNKSIFELGFFTNKYLTIDLLLSTTLVFLVINIPITAELMHFVPLAPLDWLICALTATSVLWTGEFYKAVIKRERKEL